MNISLEKYNHIIWDWNGTLLNDAWLCLELINEMLDERGLEILTMEEYKQHFDFPVKKYYEKIGFDFRRESFEKVGTDYIHRYNNRRFGVALHQGVPELLCNMEDCGKKQSILSAREQADLVNDVRYFGIESSFENIYGINDHLGGGKMDVALEISKHQDFQKVKAVLIGDTTHDFEVAKKMGINCILLANGHQTKERLLQFTDLVVDSLQQLFCEE